MPIAMRCPHCHQSFSVADELAGRQGSCNTCGAILTVPSRTSVPSGASTPVRAVSGAQADAQVVPEAVVASPTDGAPVKPTAESSLAAAAAASRELQRKIQAAFTGEIAPVRVNATYRLGVLLVSIVMVLLPLIYVALIGLVCYGVYYHMVNHIGMVGAVRGRGAILTLLAYLAPLIVGAISIFFMIKPLFARPSRDQRTRSITRDGEPILFDFVDRLCAAVGAPPPKRIDIDCQVNASAGFRRGIWSMLVGKDLVLTIGMPLVAGLSARQFAGVLAHEFGHFSQGVGMRFSFVIRSISHWFTRVVYERDTWDDWLSQSTEGLDLRIAWVLYLAKLFVWLTRKILWVLMMIGHSVAGYLLRQMEFDADRYEARLAGSETFESTCRRLHELMAANEKSQSDLGQFYNEGRLGDDLPRLIQVNVAEIPDVVKQHLTTAIDESTTGLFDTHPADRDRIASAHREQAEGLLQVDQPASDLFVHYDDLCRGVTWDFYRDIFGAQFKPSEMHPLDDLLARQRQEAEAYKALDRFFLGGFNMLRPLRLPTVHLARPTSAKAVAEKLKDVREEMTAHEAEFKRAFSAYDQADTNTMQAAGALAMYRARLSLGRMNFDIPVDTRERVKSARQDAKSAMLRQGTAMEPFEEAQGKRLVSALELLFVSKVAERIEQGESWREEARRLLPLLRDLSKLLPVTAEIRNTRTGLDLLLQQLDGNQGNESYVDAVTEHADSAGELLRITYTGLSNDAYPFDHADAAMTVSRFLMPDGPPVKGDIGGQYEAAGQFVDRMGTLYPRVASRLATMAERVERVLGLQPLEASVATGIE